MTNMSNLEDEILFLKNELDEKSKNVLLAAKYGKELLEKNNELNVQIENLIKKCNINEEKLEQGTYNWKRVIDEKEKTIHSLTYDYENQDKKMNEALTRMKQAHDEEKNKLSTKINSMEVTIDSLNKEVNLYKEKSEEFERLLSEAQTNTPDLTQSDLHDSSVDDQILNFQQQVQSLTNAKHELESNIISLKSKLKAAEIANNASRQELVNVKTELEERECQYTHIYNELERKKNEMQELTVELDQIKESQVDVRKKGNSLFAELEDNRQSLESRLISMNSKYSSLKKQIEHKNQQIATLKINAVSLLDMNSDSDYQTYLKRSLDSTKEQLLAAEKRVSELQNEAKNKPPSCNDCQGQNHQSGVNSDVMKMLYDESQAKREAMEKELKRLHFAKAALNDQLLDLRMKLHNSEKSRERAIVESVKLKAEIDNLKSDQSSLKDEEEENPTDNKPKSKMIIERLEDPSEEQEMCDKESNEELKEIIVKNKSGRISDANKFLSTNCRVTEFGAEKSVNDIQGELVTTHGDFKMAEAKNVDSSSSKDSSYRDKENHSPNANQSQVTSKKEVKSVTFGESNSKENSEGNVKKGVKSRRIMEAPRIVAEHHEEGSEECKVQ